MIWGPKADIPPQTIYEMIGFPEHEEALKEIKEIIDRHGVSLYVGRTDNIGARTNEHNTGTGKLSKRVWWNQIGLILNDPLPLGATVGDAIRAERARIQQRRPWFNYEENKPWFRWDKYNEAKEQYEGRHTQWRNPFAGIVSRARLAFSRTVHRLIPVAVGAVACAIVGAALVLNGTLIITH